MSAESEFHSPSENREKVGIRKAEKFAHNPFLRGASVQINGKKRFYNVIAKNDLIVTHEGEIRSGMGIEHKVVKIVDDGEFVKVFANGVAGIYDLNKAGKKVFSFLLETVQRNPNVDRIYLHFMDAVEEPWAISKTTFFNGMAELVAKRFIAPSDRQNMFYLNPCMIWNGDRFKFVQEYIREGFATHEEESASPHIETKAPAALPAPGGHQGTLDGDPVVKRGRGRPVGSKNKSAAEQVAKATKTHKDVAGELEALGQQRLIA